jgi:hypothetical protein
MEEERIRLEQIEFERLEEERRIQEEIEIQEKIRLEELEFLR